MITVNRNEYSILDIKFAVYRHNNLVVYCYVSKMAFGKIKKLVISHFETSRKSKIIFQFSNVLLNYKECVTITH